MTNAHTEAVEGQPVELVDLDVEAGIIVQTLMFRHRTKVNELAPVAGVSASTMSKKLRGTVSFSLSELYRIARFYDVEPGDLLPRLDSNQQPCGYLSEQVTGHVTDDELAHWSRVFDHYVAGCGLLPADRRATWSVWCLGRNNACTPGVGNGEPRDWHADVALFDRWV